MTGTAEGLSECLASITGIYGAHGESNGVGAATAGDMFADGWLAGAASGSATATVRPYADGFMSGSTAIESGELTVNAIVNGVLAGVGDAVWSYTI